MEQIDIVIIGAGTAGLTAAIYACRGKALPVERPGDEWAEKGYSVTEEQLRLRSEEK